MEATSMRVEHLATAAATSVDTIRYYQSRGLLPAPRRQGRVAWYGPEHLARLARIRELAARGLSLATIGRVLGGELDAADVALAAALSGATDRAAPDELFGIDELARRSGIPAPLLQAVAREGLLVARRRDGGEGFTAADVEIATAGLALLEAGLPLSDVLELAHVHDRAMREVAERAVALFDDHVRKPLRGDGSSPEASAARLVTAFETLLPATMALVSHHFQRTLLAVALEHIERVGDAPERAAVHHLRTPHRASAPRPAPRPERHGERRG